MESEQKNLLEKIVHYEDFNPFNHIADLKELHRKNYIVAEIENPHNETVITDVNEDKIRNLDQYDLDRDLIKPEPKGEKFLKLDSKDDKSDFSIVQNLHITGISVAFESLIGPFKEFFKRLKKSLNSG